MSKPPGKASWSTSTTNAHHKSTAQGNPLKGVTCKAGSAQSGILGDCARRRERCRRQS